MDDPDIIFATKNLKTVSKDDLIALFGYLKIQGFYFDKEKKVWHNKTGEHLDSFSYTGLLCEECGGVVVHIPIKAWNSFEKKVPLSAIHTPTILNEFEGQFYERKGGIGGEISRRPRIVWDS